MTQILEKNKELELAKAWLEDNSEKARAQLVHHYRPMIRNIARKYMRGGLSIDDLVQEGTIGFMAGLDNFDPSRGYSVGTLARFHITARIQLHVSEFTGILRLPNSRRIKGLLSKCVSTIRLEENLRGHVLDAQEKEEICMAAGFSLSELEQYEMVMRPTKTIGARASSSAGDDEGGFDLADESGSTEDIVAATQSMDVLRSKLAEILADLPQRTRTILSMRHLSDEFVSLDTIAAEVGISRERVRRIEKDALKVIRQRLKDHGISEMSDVA